MKKRNLTALILITLLLLSSTGCVAPEGQPGAGEVHVSIVLGIHDNAPVVNTALIEDEIFDACRSFGSVTLVCADGSPYSIYVDIPVAQEGLTEAKYNQIANDQCRQILQAISSMRPRTGELDTLKAIQLAARGLRAAVTETGNPLEKRLVVIDSCLSTTGVLSFLNCDLTTLDPGDIVAQLRSMDELPDLTGVTDVQVYSLGDVAGDQPALPENSRKALAAVWWAILDAGSPDVQVYIKDDLPLSISYEPGSLPPVSIVPITYNALDLPNGEAVGDLLQGNMVLTFDDKTIPFAPGSHEIRNTQEASDTLSYVADYLKRNPEAVLLVAGTTARWGGDDYCMDLAQKRAQSFCDLLIGLGANPAQLVPVGLGSSYGPFYTYDQNPDGSLNSEIAPLNRTVRVMLITSSTAQDILSTQN